MANEVIRRGLSLAESYDDWVRLAMSLTELGEDGRQIFHGISSLSDKYKERENDKMWLNACRTTRRIGLGTFVQMVKDSGVDVRPYYHADGDNYEPKRTVGVTVRKVVERTKNANYFITLDSYHKYVSYNSVFVESLFFFMTDEQIENAVSLYQLGAWSDGRVLFPRITPDGRVCDVKIMAYGLDCHRCGGVDWFASVMRRGGLVPDWYKSPKILFGLHLINMVGRKHNECRVVESCKTAVICSAEYPQYNWMATGGAMCDMAFMLRPLVAHGNKVILIPDGGKYALWLGYAAQAIETFIREGLHPYISVSNAVEDLGGDKAVHGGLDIADLLIPEMHSCLHLPKTTVPDDASPQEKLLADMICRNPSLGELIDVLQLELSA